MIIADRIGYHLHRRDQMLALVHLRPFWQFVSRCGDSNTKRITLLASDPFWKASVLPWNCQAEHCDCRVHSLSKIEMARYVEEGCSPGDEDAALMYAEWQLNQSLSL